MSSDGILSNTKSVVKGTLQVPYYATKGVGDVAGITVGAAGLLYGAVNLIATPFKLLLKLVGGGNNDMSSYYENLEGGEKKQKNRQIKNFHKQKLIQEPVVVSMSRKSLRQRR